MEHPVDELRAACREVARRGRHVRIDEAAIPSYAARLPRRPAPAEPDPAVHLVGGPRERRAAFWLTLDAINFGSGWFPTLRRRPGRSGYGTIASAIRERFERHGPWSAAELATIDNVEVAAALGQDAGHELMGLFAASLNDLGNRIGSEFGGDYAALPDAAGIEALALVERLSRWPCFADSSTYQELRLPFLKRAQLVAADLANAGLAHFADLGRLTMFADNLVPHVLRLDGILRFDAGLVDRIELGEQIEHGSAEEVEIRACAVHAVELLVASRPESRAADLDKLLWNRGQGERYKARPRHRCRCTAY